MAIAVIISSGKVFIDISSRGVIVAILLFIMVTFTLHGSKGRLSKAYLHYCQFCNISYSDKILKYY